MDVPGMDQGQMGEDRLHRLVPLEGHPTLLPERTKHGGEGDLGGNENHQHDEVDGIDASEPLDEEAARAVSLKQPRLVTGGDDEAAEDEEQIDERIARRTQAGLTQHRRRRYVREDHEQRKQASQAVECQEPHAPSSVSHASP